MTRGRHTNIAHLYERTNGDHEYGHQEPGDTHVKARGESREAAELVRGILTNDAQPAVTAHDYAARTPGAALPDLVRRLLDRRAAATERRGIAYQEGQCAAESFATSVSRGRQQATEREASIDDGMEL